MVSNTVACLTSEGEAACWGGINFYTEQDVPTNIDEPLVSISAGSLHTCAIGVSNRAYCWGLDTNGQLEVPGDGFGENGLGFLKVAADETTSCGIELDGNISCWTTDAFIQDTSELIGPFIDLDLSRREACGLQASGDIQCWGVAAFDAPNNGPYTDLVVSPSAICGLDQNQMLDCTFNSRFDVDETNYNTQTQFTAIEGLRAGNTFENNLCGLTLDGDIECPLITTLAGEPGDTAPGVSVTNRELNLTAEVYSFNNVEIFWTPIPSTIPATFVEIFRNDELVDTTDARFSWIDRGARRLGSDPLTYRVRAVNSNGDTGPFSNTITVDVLAGLVTDETPPITIDPPSTDGLIVEVNALNLGAGYFVSWVAPRVGMLDIAGYEIRLNNTIIDITSANLHIIETSNRGGCDTITVSAVSADGVYLDHRSTVRGSRLTFGPMDSCTSP